MYRFLLLFAASASILPACSIDAVDSGDPADASLEFRDALPAGSARYCSVQWPSGEWALAWGSSDPCADLAATEPPGFSIERAGTYAAEGLNNVVMRCAELVWWGRVWHEDGLSMAESYADELGLTSCTMTVAPANLPVFDAPFDAETVGGNGFDFARGETLDVAEFGQPSSNASIVDWRGQDRTGGGWADEHNGIDYNLPIGTPLYAVADGVVLASHARKVSQCGRRCSPSQEEILVQHRFSDSDPAAPTYAETFVTYYAHLDVRLVQTGDTVVRGQVIGYSGNTGCSSGPHLHFGVKRLSNTASEWYDADFTPVSANPPDCPREDNSPAPIDPYGWWPDAVGFDPWGWHFHNQGAMSINLWREGQAPARQ